MGWFDELFSGGNDPQKPSMLSELMTKLSAPASPDQSITPQNMGGAQYYAEHPKQATETAVSMVPGMGIAIAAGHEPNINESGSFQGFKDAPSVVDDFKSGHPIIGGLKIAGAIPDTALLAGGARAAGPAISAADRAMSSYAGSEAERGGMQLFDNGRPYTLAGQLVPSERIAGAAPKTSPKLLESPGVWGGEISKTSLGTPIHEMEAGLTSLPLTDKKIADVQSMSGHAIPLWGDRTAAGSILHSINGEDLSDPVRLLGGKDYMRDEAAVKDGATWASMPSAATTFANLANRSSMTKNGPVDVHAFFTPMGARSSDSSTMMLDAMLGQIKASPFSKRNAAEMTGQLRAKFGDNFPDINDTDAVRTALVDGGNMPARTKFIEHLALGKSGELGAPDVASTRFAITDPDLLGVPTLHGGQAVAKFTGGAHTVSDPSVVHPSYNTQIRGGEYEGGLPQGVPPQLLFPQTYQSLLDKGVSPKDMMYYFQRYKGGVAEPITNQWKDGISSYLQNVNR